MKKLLGTVLLLGGAAAVVLYLRGDPTVTGERIVEVLGTPRVPIVLTGAMQPFAMRVSDAVQNVTEALVAARLLTGGVYAVMHNRVLPFPGVTKDRQARTLIPGE